MDKGPLTGNVSGLFLSGEGEMMVKNCRLLVTVRDGRVDFQGDNTGMEELTNISGYLQRLIAERAVACGMDVDDVRDAMWDVYIAAMDGLGRGKGCDEDGCSQKEAVDKP